MVLEFVQENIGYNISTENISVSILCGGVTLNDWVVGAPDRPVCVCVCFIMFFFFVMRDSKRYEKKIWWGAIVTGRSR